jgi:hypothetical protein
MDRLQDETRFLHLTMRGLEHLSNVPRLVERLNQLNAEMTRERACSTVSAREDRIGVPKEPPEDREEAQWLEREIQGGFPLLHAHSVVGIWGALEVYCEDLAVVEARPKDDAKVLGVANGPRLVQ